MLDFEDDLFGDTLAVSASDTNKAAYNALAVARSLAQDSIATGSRVYVFPPPTDTDADFLLLADPFGISAIVNGLMDAGFAVDGEQYRADQDSGRFTSYRMGEVNIILTGDERFYERWIRAHDLCMDLNLKDKEDRKTVFRAFRT